MIETEIFFIKRIKKYEQRYRYIGGGFLDSLNKKESVPTGCSKKRCHVVARLARYAHIALRLAPSGKRFLPCNSTIKTFVNSV